MDRAMGINRTGKTGLRQSLLSAEAQAGSRPQKAGVPKRPRAGPCAKLDFIHLAKLFTQWKGLKGAGHPLQTRSLELAAIKTAREGRGWAKAAFHPVEIETVRQ